MHVKKKINSFLRLRSLSFLPDDNIHSSEREIWTPIVIAPCCGHRFLINFLPWFVVFFCLGQIIHQSPSSMKRNNSQSFLHHILVYF
ncbi:uncharacterized protein FA14DRAFT_18944 [Meira miltonrushii]|uniref:Uncharacterized protein n=1 Tax=Meira miltonrushii TaxID=1280837 RepID=A0A316VMZ5_9BASI|nr:uncharacterized protein FA14DRAFT_18944 [Meira miltonrushii]PWN37773.1 hypothetical protein FA14DRAFT_18944 [Meira miltonrushii]